MAETQGVLLADRYRLVEQLGRGGMGVVWRAHDEVFDREVAVKEVLLPAELARDEREGVISRTLREARVAARLSHPNVVKVYDVVRAGGRPWIVMELVRAQSLTDLIESNGPLPPAEVARIGLQVLAALGAAHAAGINHRDVKPGNVLCTDGGRVVLTDFGIASLEGDNSATSTGPLMGSPSYIAPERVRGRSASPASDLWSLAATLYAAVEGRPPYDRDGVVQTVTAVVTEDPDPYRLAGPLAPVLTKLFHKDPEERPTAAATRLMLRELAGNPNRRDAPQDMPGPRTALEASTQPAADIAGTGPAAPDASLDAHSSGPPMLSTQLVPEPHPPAARPPVKRRLLVPMALVAVAVAMLLAGGTAALNALRGDRGDHVVPTGEPPAALDQTDTGSPGPAPTSAQATPSPTVGDPAQPADTRASAPRTQPKAAPSHPAPTLPGPAPSVPASPTPSPSPPSPTPTPTPPDPPTEPTPPETTTPPPPAG